jgi:ABC-2 type transport system permease protein
MRDALWAKLVKIRRSRLPWVSVLAFTVAAGVGGLFMFILSDPGRARRLGLLGTKAQLLNGTADWPTYPAHYGRRREVRGHRGVVPAAGPPDVPARPGHRHGPAAARLVGGDRRARAGRAARLRGDGRAAGRPVRAGRQRGPGYLAAVGVMLGTVFVTQVIAALGYGQYSPWSVPAILSGVAGPDQPAPSPVGYLLVIAVGAAGAAAMAAWWRGADQTT